MNCRLAALLALAVLGTAGAPAFAADGVSCNLTCSPAEWQSMSIADKAERWPTMTSENRRRIWNTMDDEERRALREKLRPLSHNEFRRHYECAVMSPPPPPGFAASQIGHDMPPLDRQHMRSQIIQVHQEFIMSGHPPHPAPGHPSGRPH